MDLRDGITGATPEERCAQRRSRVEKNLNRDLSALIPAPGSVGHADEKNCEQMLGHIPLPVGYAGPLGVTFSSGEKTEIHLPLATTEGALVASVNRGCKAISRSGGALTQSMQHGISRSMAFRCGNIRFVRNSIDSRKDEWFDLAQSTSNHLKILKYEVDERDAYLFLTIFCDTDEAMGMNMVTIAGQAVGDWIVKNIPDVTFVTVAANVDSDKKPSSRTHERGRGYEVTAEMILTPDVIRDVLKMTPEGMLAVSEAKLTYGSDIAGAVGKNLHAANIVAALYLATGQDAAHVVEGSLTDTTVTPVTEGLKVIVRCPAILVGVRGGGTTLPAQMQCLNMLLQPKTSLHRKDQLAQSIAAAVLAGEISLLAAQAGHMLASAHGKLGR